MNSFGCAVGLCFVLAGCGDAALDGAGGDDASGGGEASGVAECPYSEPSGSEAHCQVEGQTCTYCCDDFACGLVDPDTGSSPCQGWAPNVTFTCVDGEYEAPPAPPSCDHEDSDSCGADSDCRWLRPGCDVPNGFVEGCYPKADCQIDGCSSTFLSCESVTLACDDDTCGCEEAETNVCLSF